MTTLDVRTPPEVAALRAVAEGRAGDTDSYDHVSSRAVLATLDWITGQRANAPASGDRMTVDDVIERGAWRPTGLIAERVRAEDMEREHAGNGRAWVWPGVVAQTLRWYERQPQTEAPVL